MEGQEADRDMIRERWLKADALLTPEKRARIERYGTDSMRAVLASWDDIKNLIGDMDG